METIVSLNFKFYILLLYKMPPKSDISIVKVLRKIQERINGGFRISNKVEKGVIAEVSKDNKSKYIITDTEAKDDSPMVIDNLNYEINAYIPVKDVERFIALLTGKSGGGKTAIAYILMMQYIKHYNKNLYYICETSKDDDINLKKISNLKQIPTDSLEDFKIENYKNSLFFVDDIDYSPNHKQCMSVINKITETGRKFGVSLIFASHINTKGNESCIYKELTLYFTNIKNIEENRVLSNYLHLKKHQIDKLLIQKDSAFICINALYNVFITDKIVEKL